MPETRWFRVGLLPVQLSPTERGDCEQLSHKMAKAAFEFEEHLGLKEPFERFMKQVELIAEGSPAGPTWTARRYQKTISARRTLLADTSARTTGFERLLPIISDASRTLVFGERAEQAERFAALLNRHQVASSAIHSDVPLDERQLVGADFLRVDLFLHHGVAGLEVVVEDPARYAVATHPGA